jgi:hypothetical protein
MAYVITIILAFAAFQFLWSIRLAYRIERYQLAAGYPILGHVLHTLCIVLILSVFAPRHTEFAPAARAAIGLVGLALPVIHGWLLIRYTHRGEAARLAADRSGSP